MHDPRVTARFMGLAPSWGCPACHGRTDTPCPICTAITVKKEVVTGDMAEATEFLTEYLLQRGGRLPGTQQELMACVAMAMRHSKERLRATVSEEPEIADAGRGAWIEFE